MQGLPTSYFDDNGEYGSCLDLVGHVQGEACGFQTGPAVARDLLLKQPFQEDCLFVTELCQHAWLDEDTRVAVCACRGFVHNFSRSAIAKASAASEYADASFQQQQQMRETANDHCTYCSAPIFELQEDVFFDIQESFRWWWQRLFDRYSPDWFDVTGRVCGNGHLTIEVFGNRAEASFLENMPSDGSGQGLVVETSELLKTVCDELSPKQYGFCELAFWRDLNPFTLSWKLTRLATEIEGYQQDEEVRELISSMAHLHSKSDFIEVIPRIDRRADEVIQIYKDSFREVHGSSSEEIDSENSIPEDSQSSDSKDRSAEDFLDLSSKWAEHQDFEEALPFWSVPSDNLEIVRDFQDDSLSGSAAQMVYTYLCDDKPSARMVLTTVLELDILCLLRSQAKDKVEQMEQERRGEIEAALAEAGVKKSGGKWPLPEAIDSYIEDPNVSLDEAVDRQRKCLREAEEKRAAERAQRESEAAMRRAEQEAKTAERNAWRERKEAAERVFRASQGLAVCPGTSDGKSCSNLGSEACVLSACGICCRTYTMGVICKRHKQPLEDT